MSRLYQNLSELLDEFSSLFLSKKIHIFFHCIIYLGKNIIDLKYKKKILRIFHKYNIRIFN